MTTATAPAQNGPAPPASGLTVPTNKPEKLVVHDTGPAAYLFDTARFEHCYRIATAMAKASLIPDHLTIGRDKKELPMDMIIGNCFMIVNQAIRWGMDPFALPAETYVVGSKLGFQGKLVAAVINARAGLHHPLSAIYTSGRGDDLAAVVFGSREPIPKDAWPLLKLYAKDESGEAYTDLMALGVLCIRISVGQAKTANQMWTKDPQQKLFYSGATKWARRHAPEIILGVLTDDDLERIQGASGDGRGMVVETMDQLTDKILASRAAMTSVVEGEVADATPESEAPAGDRPATSEEPRQSFVDALRARLNEADTEPLIDMVEKDFSERAANQTELSVVAGECQQAREHLAATAPAPTKGKPRQQTMANT